MPETSPLPETPTRSLSRRTVLAGGAWAAPAIALAVAAPLAAASITPPRTLLASSRVAVPLANDPTWDTQQYGHGKMNIPYSPVVLGLSFTNLGDPLEAGEVFIQGLLTSAAKNDLNLDLFILSAVNNNHWTYVAAGVPQHASATVDAAYPIWFQYQLPLATNQTSETVYFTANPTGAVAAHRIVNGTLQIPSQILYSRAYINADLTSIPSGTTGVTNDFRGPWSNTPLPGTTDMFYLEPEDA